MSGMSDVTTKDGSARKAPNNRGIVIACVLFASTMGGMAYAAVPLYQLFCQVTGYGGTTQRVEQASDTVLDQTIRVRFDANVNGLPWSFRPKQREVELKIGETVQVEYQATNNSERQRSGQATFNVTPQAAGAYFNKVECFCFTEMALQPGETIDMPVVFFIDPAIVEAQETRNIGTITLSYTFFPHDTDAPIAAAPAADEGVADRL
jgi:cytochrome c oxidase assembly protein subunit 11